MATIRTRPLVAALPAAVLACVLFAACTDQSPESLIVSAKQYLDKRDYNAAVIQLKNVLQAAPHNGEARLLLGTALLQARDFAFAESELQRALDLGQPPDAVVPALARAMMEQGEYARLLTEFGARKLSSARAEAELAVLIGQAHLRLGQSEQADLSYRTALKAQAEYAPARLGMAMIAAATGQRGEAMKITDSVLAAAPDLADAYLLKADLLGSDGDLAGARKVLEKAVEVDATHLPARTALAQVLIANKALEHAATQIEAARKLAPGDLTASFLTALLELERGDMEKARTSAAQVLKYAPGHVPTRVVAGALELRSKHLASAETHLREALSKAPDHSGARRLLVEVHLQSGHPARALQVLRPLLTSAEIKDPWVAMLAGETYLANGDNKRAAVYFTSAAGADTARTQAQTRLGQLALARGDLNEGLALLESASEHAESVRADLSLISVHLERNEFDKAMAAAQVLERKQPKNPLSHFMLGTVNLARKDGVAAREGFEKALQLQPTYIPALYSLANVDLQENKPADARKRFEALIAKEPRNEQGYLGLADVQRRSGSPTAEVAATLQRGLDFNPQAADVWLAMASLHLNAGSAKEALKFAREAVAAIPNEPRLLSTLASALEATGNVNEAIETLVKLSAIEPHSAQPLVQLAVLHSRRQEFDLALDALRRAQGAAPDDRNVRVRLVMTLKAARKFDEAINEAKAIQKSEPTFSGGYVAEAEVHAAQKKWRDAERALGEALKVDPRSGDVATQLHFVLLQAGKTGDAEAFARKWLVHNPKDASMRLYLADRARAAKQMKAAFSLYHEAIDLQPDNPFALNNMAFVAGELGDARAVDYAERAVKLAPNNAAILDTLGIILVNKGEVAKGFEYLDKARALAPNSLALRLSYAKALAKAGRKGDARKELEALNAAVEDSRAKEEIQALLKSL